MGFPAGWDRMEFAQVRNGTGNVSHKIPPILKKLKIYVLFQVFFEAIFIPRKDSTETVQKQWKCHCLLQKIVGIQENAGFFGKMRDFVGKLRTGRDFMVCGMGRDFEWCGAVLFFFVLKNSSGT
jgi:hypothetical protein